MFRLIRQAHIFAPEDLGVKDLLLCNDKIIKVSEHISFDWDPEELEIVDAAGKYLVPGFIDQHVHIIGGGGEDGFASLIREIQMTDCVRYGVTTVVGLLGTDHHAKSIETLVARTKALKEQGMTAYCLTGSYCYPSVNLTGTPEKDVAFIDEVIGVKLAIAEARGSYITKDELVRLACHVRDAGFLSHKPGFVHLHTGRGKNPYGMLLDIVNTTDLPITSFRPTHVNIDEPSAQAFGKAGGYLDFTSGIRTEVTAHNLKKALNLGIPLRQLTLSTDSNGSFPKWNEDHTRVVGMGIGKMVTLFDTIRHLIRDEGVSMSDALCIVTKNPASALDLYPKKGHIAAGSDADLVLLNQDLTLDSVYALGKPMLIDGKLTAKNYYDYEE
ncbi:beta-aspartyl-peptidase [Oribacterium sp. HCP28S3_H8]|uniref:beta-aspartyl-peptidase n=1 Tax=Oribacterium sp. HCP28S3_H8 TaxID=3438945 RepID=UPI003F8B8B21